MPNPNPSPSQILAALKKHGVDVKTHSGWDTAGRPWRGPDGSPGLTGAVVHHTANAGAAEGKSMAGIVSWAVTAYDRPVCNLLVGKEETWLLSAGSAYHCGAGGPVPELGIERHGYFGQSRLFGIEIDDAGVSTTALNKYQIENTAKTLAALAELCGWDVDKSILTHKCYTDLCHTSAKSQGESTGRKNDTIDGAWRQFPGDKAPKPYNAPWWREKVKAAMGAKARWDGTIPSRAAVNNAIELGRVNKAVFRLNSRLFDLGYLKAKPNKKTPFAVDAFKAFRRAQGWNAGDNPKLSAASQRKLFGKDKP